MILNNLKIESVEKIKEAFENIDRKNFVLPEYKNRAYDDTPLPIGFDQTISQPTTVGIMLSLLDIKKGLRVLDVGAGSGWTTALLKCLVSNNGYVVGVERIPELVEFGNRNISEYYPSTRILLSGDEFGYSKEAPYDRILVSASATGMPVELIDQLEVGGIMVLPIGNSLFKVTKLSEDPLDIVSDEYPGFSFVPLL